MGRESRKALCWELFREFENQPVSLKIKRVVDMSVLPIEEYGLEPYLKGVSNEVFDGEIKSEYIESFFLFAVCLDRKLKGTSWYETEQLIDVLVDIFNCENDFWYLPYFLVILLLLLSLLYRF